MPRKDSRHSVVRVLGTAVVKILGLAMLTAIVLGTQVRAESARPSYSLMAVGNENALWLVVGEQDAESKQYVQYLACYDTAIERPMAVRGLGPQVGRIALAGLVGDSLHVFYADEAGAHFRYDRLGSRRETRLPGQVLPVAVSGTAGSGAGMLWAVVEARTANAVETAWHEVLRRQLAEAAGQDDSRRAATQAAVDLTPIQRPEGTYHLVQYDGAYWKPGFSLPPIFSPTVQVWLRIGPQRQYLLWQDVERAEQIHTAWREEGGWRIGPLAILSGRPSVGAAGLIPKGLVLAVLVAPAEAHEQLVCEVWLWPVDRDPTTPWQTLPAPLDDQGRGLRLPAGSSLAVFDEQLALLRMEPDSGRAEAGFWPVTGGAPKRDFEVVPKSAEDQRRGRRRGLEDYLTVLILGALVFLVFWRRQDSIASLVPLPEHLALAGYGRRALAAGLDMLPAALVVGRIWHEPLGQYARELGAAWQVMMNGTPEALEAVPVPAPLFWAWLVFRLLYSGYCTGFELAWARTPGKRLLGCWVVSETGSRPTAGQVCIRNLTRLVELEERLLIWPFVLVLFVTQNRQRIGDLLARTLVVEGMNHRQ